MSLPECATAGVKRGFMACSDAMTTSGTIFRVYPGTSTTSRGAF
jgi:hypothetical protein